MPNKTPTPSPESDPFVYGMKKLLAMFGFAMATVVAFADPLPEGGPYKEMVDGIEWTFMVDANLNASVESGCNSIAAIPRLTVGDIVIPAALGGHPVTIVGDFAFYQCDDLTSVTIPFDVTSVGDWAFGGCDHLAVVDFECAPPFGVASASINQDAAIRYNVKYFDEWQPIIKQCGWTNAKPYSPNPGFMFFLR